MTLDILGTGRDTKDEILAAVARRYGSFGDIQEIIVIPNPAPSEKIAGLNEYDFIRDVAPPTHANTVTVGGFGEVREDSLIAKWSSGEILLNTWISDALWALSLYNAMKDHADAGRVEDSLRCAGRVGFYVAKMALNGVIGAANTKHGWNRKTDEKTDERNDWLLRQNRELDQNLSKRRRALILEDQLQKYLEENPNTGWQLIDFEQIRKKL